MKTVRMYRKDGKFVDVPEDAPDIDVYRKSWPLEKAPKGSEAAAPVPPAGSEKGK